MKKQARCRKHKGQKPQTPIGIDLPWFKKAKGKPISYEAIKVTNYDTKKKEIA